VPRVVAHATPNPDSLKFTVDGDPTAASPSFLETGLAAYRSPAEAAGDALGEALFAIPGVAGVLILPAFVTVNRTPGTDWGPVASAVESVLNAHLSRAA
jgi:hypothetical protein